MADPHDHLFQLVFADPIHAVPLLRSALPAAIARLIDWSTLTRKKATQRGRRGRKTLCDVLFAARTLCGRRLLLYVVLEHKSRSHRFDALQILEQVVAVLRTHRREHPKDPFLPPVLPVVVHADHRPWRSPLDVRELFDLESIPTALHHYLPACRYLLDDLHQGNPEQLRQRALTVYGLCTLSMLQYLPPAARTEPAFAAWLDAWADNQREAAALAETMAGHDVYGAMVDYILTTARLPGPTVQRLLISRIHNPAMKHKLLSTAQQIRNEGKAEGRAEGKISVLLRLITRRFGHLGPHAADRLQTASPTQLDRWAERILDARSLDELFAD